jgi:hypothetical protein
LEKQLKQEVSKSKALAGKLLAGLFQLEKAIIIMLTQSYTINLNKENKESQ